MTAEADALDVYYQLTVRIPTGRALDWLNELVSDHGEAFVCDALAAEAAENSDIRTLLSRTQARLERLERAEAKLRSEREAKSEADYQALMAAMPDEQREANRLRLRQMMVDAGLIEEGANA